MDAAIGAEEVPRAGREGRETAGDRKPRRRQTGRWLLAALGVFVLFAVAVAWLIGGLGGNVREVSPGRVYRSAQLTGTSPGAMTACWTGHSLEQTIQQHHIQTVLNLRGGNPRDGWYQQELQTCARMGVGHVDVSMSAVRFPNPVQLRRVLDVFDHARYPILYHCQGGSDRSGLVGTLYKNVYEGVPLDQAEGEQLTARYAHFSWTNTRSMDDFFDLYRRTNQGLSLRQWIVEKYPALYEQVPARLHSDPPSPLELASSPLR